MNHWNNQFTRDPDSVAKLNGAQPRRVVGEGTLHAAESPHKHQMGALSLAYPPAVAQCPCEASALLIRSAYCGIENAELGAVMQYFYQSMQLEECAPLASAELMKISICEMRHLRLLGKLLCSMNSDPRFYAPRRSARGMHDFWWTAQPPAVHYTENLRDALCANIAAEQASIFSYRRIVQQCNDTGIVPLIERIILDEEEHLRIFTALLQRLCG